MGRRGLTRAICLNGDVTRHSSLSAHNDDYWLLCVHAYPYVYSTSLQHPFTHVDSLMRLLYVILMRRRRRCRHHHRAHKRNGNVQNGSRKTRVCVFQQIIICVTAYYVKIITERGKRHPEIEKERHKKKSEMKKKNNI